ncbi:MAG: FAD-dependent oxidoreductase [Candidatus Aureabacteria bacterium]|nr:FAD-dependent oxidoreductase [Candidatus Auribacterota bacterium]
MKIGILGGGLTGLSLAYFLGEDAEVLEKDDVCGGLCRTVVKDGYSYDYGGHIIFSRDGEVLKFMEDILGENKVRYRRNNRIWFKGRFVKYPFENDLAALPKEDIYECLHHFLTRNYPEPKNFKEWCYYRFGKGIAERYIIPYSEKIWNIETDKMGLEWVRGRIPEPPLEDVLKSALGIETEGYTHQLYFYYPKIGGIEALIHAIKAKVARVERNFCVRQVRKSNDRLVVSDGARERVYNRLVSTIPIFDLLRSLEDVPQEVQRAAKRLRYNSLICVMIAVRSGKPSDKFAVYFPQRELKFHRVCFYDYFGNSCVPQGKTLAVAEITVNKGDGTCEMGDEELVEHVIAGLEKEGFIARGDVCATDVSRREYAYVVNDLHYSGNLRVIHDFINARGITLCGRFSEWKYLNMDACIRSAMKTAEDLR